MTGTVLIRLTGSLGATLVAYGVYRVAKFIYDELTSPLRDLPGPKSSSFIYGNFKEIFEAENSTLHEQWVQEYGTTLKYNGLFGMTRLYTTDTKALNHVLMNSYIWQKPEVARYNLSRVLGPGVLVVEEDKHRQQRKIMNPAFGPAHIRELTTIFVEKAIQLRDVWATESSKQGGTGRIDVLSWLSRATLDIIGLAGFNYEFNALSDQQNELNDAFAQVFKAGQRLTIIPFIRGFFPLLRFLPDRNDAQIHQSRKTMSRIANGLLTESKAVATGTGEKQGGRDLFSLLVRANMENNLPASQRMSDQDVLAQVPTFFVAGHETTSSGTTWALFALTQDLRVQAKLRDELLTVDTDNPTMDQLNALPYLDMVLRETLRLHAPVPSTVRVAVKDDILPLGIPVTDRKGRVHEFIKVRKGQTILVSILAMNRDKSIWGEDAKEFRPERWESIPEAAGSIPGVWGNMLTFLGGPRACIGFRFTVVEMKALIFTLVRAFEFELAVPSKDIVKKSSVVQRPVLVTDPDGGNQMPLLIKPYVHP